MKKYAFCLVVLLTATLVGTAWAGKEKEKPQIRLQLDLVDGSRIIGIPRIESVPVQTSYAKIDVQLKQILAIRMGEDHETASLDMKNGDKLKGVINLGTVKLDTVFGKLSVGVEQILELRVVFAGGAMPDALRQGLVLYYSFGRDEGGKVTDASEKQNHGEARGAKWTPHGKIGGAYEMDGSDSRIESTRNVGIEGATPRTLIAWVRCDEIAVGQESVPVGFGKANCYADPYCSGTLYAIGIHCRSGTNTIGMWGVNHGDVWSPTPFSTRRWQHVASTFDGKVVRFYMNGNLDLRKNVSLTTPPSPLAIGRVWGDYPSRSRFVGAVDEVMVFDHALTEKEIGQIFDAQNGEPVPEDSGNAGS